MRVCLMIEGQEGVTWDQWRALAAVAEEAGFEALFRSDHYQSLDGSAPGGSLDAWATINALAATTETLRLGTLVSPATFRHPSTLAREVVTADHVSGGRVELGLGAGWHEGEHRAHGFEFPETPVRMERLAEQLEIVSRTWTEESFSFEGRHYRAQEPGPGRPLGRRVQHRRRRLGGAAGAAWETVGGLARGRPGPGDGPAVADDHLCGRPRPGRGHRAGGAGAGRHRQRRQRGRGDRRPAQLAARHRRAAGRAAPGPGGGRDQPGHAAAPGPPRHRDGRGARGGRCYHGLRPVTRSGLEVDPGSAPSDPLAC